MVFRGRQRTGSTSVQLSQNTQLLEGFFAMTDLLALAEVNFHVLVCQKTDRRNIRSPSAAVLSRPELSAVE